MTHDLGDPWAAIRRLQEELRDLRTANPLTNASIGAGGISILTPGETPDGGGVELYKFGHGSGTKRGFLFKDGNDWKTLEVYIDERVNAGTAQPNARLTDIEGRMTSAEAGINFTANRTTDLEGRMGSAEGRLATAEGGITYTSNRVGDLEGRMSNAESSLNNKASTSSVTAVQTQANNTATELGQLKVVVAQIKDRYNDHIDAGHPGFPKITA